MCAISSVLQYRSAAPVVREAVQSHKEPRPIVGKLRRRDASPHTPRP